MGRWRAGWGVGRLMRWRGWAGGGGWWLSTLYLLHPALRPQHGPHLHGAAGGQRWCGEVEVAVGGCGGGGGFYGGGGEGGGAKGNEGRPSRATPAASSTLSST